MRPRQICRGIVVRMDPGESISRVASMRPRQICRGIEAAHVGDRGLSQASMRPRQICRGILSTCGTSPTPGASFNEAPTDLPGNSACTTAVLGVQIRLQ